MESLFFILRYLSHGRLPGEYEQNSQDMMQKQSTIPIEELCQDLPHEFSTYIRTVRELDFDQEPDYAFLDQIFRRLVQQRRIPDDFNFLWLDLKLHPARAGSS